MRERNCYICEDELDFIEYMDHNEEPDKVKAKIWKSKHTRIFCCSCLKKLKLLADPNEKAYHALVELHEKDILKRLNHILRESGLDLIKIERLRKEGELL